MSLGAISVFTEFTVHIWCKEHHHNMLLMHLSVIKVSKVIAQIQPTSLAAKQSAAIVVRQLCLCQLTIYLRANHARLPVKAMISIRSL